MLVYQTNSMVPDMNNKVLPDKHPKKSRSGFKVEKRMNEICRYQYFTLFLVNIRAHWGFSIDKWQKHKYQRNKGYKESKVSTK